MRDSLAYKTYLASATGAATPKKARKLKKPLSLSKKRTLTPDVFVSKKKVPAKAERSKRIDLVSEASLLEEAQVKKYLKRSRRETTIHQVGGPVDGIGSKPGVLDEPKGKSSDTSKGTGLKPGVPAVSKADSSKKEYESWGDSDDDNDDDDENLTKGVDEEEYERIQIDLYDNVNVRLTDAEQNDEEMTYAGHVDAEHVNVNQEGAVKSEVFNTVKEFLGTNLDEALYKVLKKHDVGIIKEFSSIIEDENAMGKGVADQLKKRKPDDGEKDKGLPLDQTEG
nr:hypothetical protein [Tanacetum cinerariifolium]